MSKSKKSDAQKINDVSKNAKETSSATRREQLMVEIRSLKLLIATIDTAARPIKFEDVCKKKLFPTTNERQKSSNLVDVGLVMRNELYSLAGVCSKKVGNAFIFGFECWNIEGPKNGYWIKLYNEADQWQLGCWLMPMSVNPNDILTKFSIDSPNDMIYFLRECKHQIECYNRRKQQYHELEEIPAHEQKQQLRHFFQCFLGFTCNGHYFYSNAQNVSHEKAFMNTNGYTNGYVEADNSFMRITIKFFRETCSSPDESRRIRVDLYYKTDETRSSKMIIDCDDVKEMSDVEMKKLKIYFKRFKELNLKNAAEKILSSEESRSIWRRVSQDEAFEIDEDLENEVEASYMAILEKSAKASKKIHNRSRIDHVDLSNSENIDEEPRNDGKKREKNKKSGKKKIESEKINVEKNNEIKKSSRDSSTIVNKLPFRDRNENFVNLLSKMTRIDKNGKLLKNHIALTSSTPLAGRIVPFSNINEDEISEISIAAATSEKKSRKKRQLDESDSSADSVEKNVNEQAELLKDLRAVRDEKHSTRKQPQKLTKRKSKSPTKGTNKIAKK